MVWSMLRSILVTSGRPDTPCCRRYVVGNRPAFQYRVKESG
ncbi:hypothetical protein [Geobacter benzoatilyticus]|nr:hypothetical protein [Geobacter benzoatilyticus]